jgi:hypothetical protein
VARLRFVCKLIYLNTHTQLISFANVYSGTDADRFSLSPALNLWAVRLGTRVYAVTCAHNVVFNKSNVWTMSKFLDPHGWSTAPWFVHKNYFQNPSSEFDLAFSPICESSPHLHPTTVSDPTSCSFYFRQPYDKNGIWGPSSLAALRSTVYQSPQSELLEAVDVGFRGMSGAVAVDEEGRFWGMFLRRAVSIMPKPYRNLTNPPDGTISAASLSHRGPQVENTGSSKKTAACPSDVPVGLSHRGPQVENTGSSKKTAACPSDVPVGLWRFLNGKFDEVDARFTEVERTLDGVVKVQHLDEIFAASGLRRGLVMPSSIMCNLIANSSEHISVRDVIGYGAHGKA